GGVIAEREVREVAGERTRRADRDGRGGGQAGDRRPVLAAQLLDLGGWGLFRGPLPSRPVGGPRPESQPPDKTHEPHQEDRGGHHDFNYTESVALRRENHPASGGEVVGPCQPSVGECRVAETEPPFPVWRKGPFPPVCESSLSRSGNVHVVRALRPADPW